MSESLTREAWDSISAELRTPFDPADVEFRQQTSGKSKTGDEAPKKAQAVCYVESRAIMDRLDEVVGPGDWSFDWTPLVIEKGEVQIAKGTLTLFGVAKSDVGDASSFSPSKGCVSDTLKRCAVLWGIGRYLYDVPSVWVDLDQYGRIPAETVKRLRAQLPKPATLAGQQRPQGYARMQVVPGPESEPVQQPRPTERRVSEKVVTGITKQCQMLGKPVPDDLEQMTPEEAANLSHTLSEEYRATHPVPGEKPATPRQTPPTDTARVSEPAAAEAEGGAWNPLADLAFRQQCTALGWRRQEQVRELVEAHGGWWGGEAFREHEANYAADEHAVRRALASEQVKAQKAQAAQAPSGDLAALKTPHVRP